MLACRAVVILGSLMSERPCVLLLVLSQTMQCRALLAFHDSHLCSLVCFHHLPLMGPLSLLDI